MIELFSTLSILKVSALIGLFSLIVPILIHLFNPNRGKLILIGNIRLIKKKKAIRSTEINFRQWLLFIVRAIILILLTLLLADLVRNTATEIKPTTDIYLTSDWLLSATFKQRQNLLKTNPSNNSNYSSKDSFKKSSDSRVYLLIDGIEEIEWEILNQEKLPPLLVRKLTATRDKNLSISSLIGQIEKRSVIAETNLVYLTSKLNSYSIRRHSDLVEKSYSIKMISITPKEINSTSSFNQSLEKKLSIVVFYSPERQIDYQYLQLALATLSKGTAYNLDVRYISLDAEQFKNSTKEKLSFSFEEQPNWIFWLNDSEVPKRLLKLVEEGSYLLRDSQGGSFDIDNNPIIRIDDFNVAFYKLSFPANMAQSVPLWFSHQDKIALTSSLKGKGLIYHFNSRFHPKWTDLVGDIQFPVILSRLLNSHPKVGEYQIISETEVRSLVEPSVIGSVSIDTTSKAESINEKSDSKSTTTQSLRNLLLFIICLFWLFERYLSERSRLENE